MRAHVVHNMYSRAGENTFFVIEYAKHLGTTGGHPHIYIYIYIYIYQCPHSVPRRLAEAITRGVLTTLRPVPSRRCRTVGSRSRYAAEQLWESLSSAEQASEPRSRITPGGDLKGEQLCLWTAVRSWFVSESL